MKEIGMPVVSLRSVDFGFSSHLGASGKTAIFLAVKVSFKVAREEMQKKKMFENGIS